MFNYIHDYLIWNSMSGYIEIGTERAVTDAPLIFGTSTAANEIGTECAVTDAAVYL